FATAVVGCIFGGLIERVLPLPRWVCVIDYRDIDALIVGSLMGLGAMLGELPNSFVKRQLGIAPGAHARGPRRVVFYLWDQVDLLCGAWPLIACWAKPTLALVLASIALA